MKKKLSPIAQSIARKQAKLQKYIDIQFENPTPSLQEFMIILREEIEADQKLLEVEREELIKSERLRIWKWIYENGYDEDHPVADLEIDPDKLHDFIFNTDESIQKLKGE